MNYSLEEYYDDNFTIGDNETPSLSLLNFIEQTSTELLESGIIEGIEIYQYMTEKGSRKPKRVDGYWLNEDGVLDLFVVDYHFSETLQNIANSEIKQLHTRLINFIEYSFNDVNSEDELEEEQLYSLINKSKGNISKINCYILTNRKLGNNVVALPNETIGELTVNCSIWDVSRFYRQSISSSQKEPLNISLTDIFDQGILCLPAHTGSNSLQSYLAVIPGKVLAQLYGLYGTRLLEQNVRCFLQARGNVNKGIKTTIVENPEMFFAYNNGITATAKNIEVRKNESGLEIINIQDLQIVNGGQTTASLFHTAKKEKANLDDVYVQMKLSIVEDELSSTIVPKISEYANTQNKVNAADFFSNHPYHIRIEEFSRRIYIPLKSGEIRETKWFYERARGQYNDAISKLTIGEAKRFRDDHPKKQMFTKTDLAKYINVWEEDPLYVNNGAQKNFTQFATRIGGLWKKSSEEFNEIYYKNLIAKAIIFKSTEGIVSSEEWYGGYRANIVAYSIACLSEFCKKNHKAFNFELIWEKQSINLKLTKCLKIISAYINEKLMSPPPQFKNVTEWAKKPLCWQVIQEEIEQTESEFSPYLLGLLIDDVEERNIKSDAKKVQTVDNSIAVQKRVIEFGVDKWKALAQKALTEGRLSEKEMEIISTTVLVKNKIPTPRQSEILRKVMDRYELA